MIHLTLYAVRFDDGKWFRSRGYGGYGDHRVPELKDAKLYSKIGQARGRVTFFAKRWPEYSAPSIVELHVTQLQVVNDGDRVQKTLAKNEARERKRKEEQRLNNVGIAKSELKAAQKRIAQLEREANK